MRGGPDKEGGAGGSTYRGSAGVGGGARQKDEQQVGLEAEKTNCREISRRGIMQREEPEGGAPRLQSKEVEPVGGGGGSLQNSRGLNLVTKGGGSADQ